METSKDIKGQGAIRAFFGINMRKMKIQVSRMIIW
jgi:hypothetical protein